MTCEATTGIVVGPHDPAVGELQLIQVGPPLLQNGQPGRQPSSSLLEEQGGFLVGLLPQHDASIGQFIDAS